MDHRTHEIFTQMNNLDLYILRDIVRKYDYYFHGLSKHRELFSERDTYTAKIIAPHKVAFGTGQYIYIYDVKEETLKSLSGHHNDITTIEMLSDGRLVTGSRDQSIYIWNKQRFGRFTYANTRSIVNDIVVLPGDIIVAGLANGNLKVWHQDNEHFISGTAEAIHKLVVIDAHRVVSMSYFDDCHIWNIETEQREATLPDSSETRALLIYKNRILCGMEMGDVRVYSTSGQFITSMGTRDGDDIQCMSLISEGFAAVGTYGGIVKVYNLKTYMVVNVLSIAFDDKDEEPNTIMALLRLPDGRMAIGTRNPIVYVYNPVTEHVESFPQAHSTLLLLALPDHRFVSVSSKSQLTVWE